MNSKNRTMDLYNKGISSYPLQSNANAFEDNLKKNNAPTIEDQKLQ